MANENEPGGGGGWTSISLITASSLGLISTEFAAVQKAFPFELEQGFSTPGFAAIVIFMLARLKNEVGKIRFATESNANKVSKLENDVSYLNGLMAGAKEKSK